MIKLICSDMDGTLVPDGTDKINTDIYDVILKLKEHGIMFAAISGRQCEGIINLFRPIKNELIFAGENGGVILCRDQILATSSLPKSVAYEIIQDIKKMPGCSIMVGVAMTCYVERDSLQLIDLLTNGYHFNVTIVDDLLKDIPNEDEIVKVSLFHPTDAEGVSAEVFYPKWSNHPDVQCLCAGVEWMDCISAEAGKGTAVEHIQTIMGIKPSETMAFGDNLNDIGMLQKAEYSYAVANARDEVKEAANYLTDSNVNDGVLKILKKLLAELEK